MTSIDVDDAADVYVDDIDSFDGILARVSNARGMR